MAFDLSKIPDAYELISEEDISDVNSRAALLRHKKTGARVAVLSNDDNNKVFSIGFRTPPQDSTGVAHITEHSVLCGSDKYPAKDPFVELLKGSLNTFLNAMTYPDKTVYPVASCNDADFKNLMDIYLDAVFHPNIYIHDEIFRQEGWHYEIDSRDGQLSYNGVVYNEMKGAFSSPEEVLYRKISTSLYPDTTYSVESGGDPDVIPRLTYEQFLDFHRRYYHPSNSYIYLYGDMDVAERLDYMDREYLCGYDYAPVDSAVADQMAFASPVTIRDQYPSDSQDAGAYLACSWVVEKNGDVRTYIAFQILEYLLMDAPGAPLKQALQDRGLGDDIYGSFETSVKQPYLSIIIKNIKPERKDEALGVIRDELEKLAGGALSRRSLEGAVNGLEFKSREADFGRWPKGLMWGLQMMDSWLYDDGAPFEYLKYEKAYDFFRQNLDSGYFAGLIREFLLDNPHSSVIMLTPKAGLTAEREQALKEKLSAYKASLAPEQIDELILQNKELKAYQSEPSPKEVLEKIPLLSVSDIKKNVRPLKNEEIREDGLLTVFHDIQTNGIAYINILFDTSHIEEKDIPYLGILSELLGELNTQDYTYQEMTDEINLYTGGVKTNISVYPLGDAHRYRPVFSVEGKALCGKLPQLFHILGSMVSRTDYRDTTRIKDILSQTKSRLEMSFMSSGHAAAVSRSSSYYSESSWYKELTSGIEFYRFISSLLYDFDKEKDDLVRKLILTAGRVFRKDRMILGWTGDKDGLAMGRESVRSFLGGLNPADPSDCARINVGTCPTKREAFTTPGTVQYNCVTGDFSDKGLKFSGAMNVLKNILSNEFLWNQVRVKGGAYGVMCGFSSTGDGYFTSYRDPGLSSTFDIYRKAADYIRNFDPDEREMRKFTIGAFGMVDTPLTASMAGDRSMSAYMSGRKLQDLQEIRDQMLAVTPEVIRGLADAAQTVAESGNICVIGSQSAVMAQKEMFDTIRPLIWQPKEKER